RQTAIYFHNFQKSKRLCLCLRYGDLTETRRPTERIFRHFQEDQEDYRYRNLFKTLMVLLILLLISSNSTWFRQRRQKTTNPRNPSFQSSSSSEEQHKPQVTRRAVSCKKESFQESKGVTFIHMGVEKYAGLKSSVDEKHKRSASPKANLRDRFQTKPEPSLNPFPQTDLKRLLHTPKKRWGLGVLLVDQGTKKRGVLLKRWGMNGSWNYALANGLKDGDNITLWSFRCRGVLCFALVPLSYPFLREGNEDGSLLEAIYEHLMRHGGEMEVLQRSGT
ncbi:LOW QUALITY PROTEIN: hypothetical protein HID58_013809, partial [Brassica napus]